MTSNLGELRAAVADYLNRADLTLTELAYFIDNGRRAAAQYLAREQEAVAVLTLDAELEAPLPANFIAARYVTTAAGEPLSEIHSAFAAVGVPGYRIVGQRIRVSDPALVAGSQIELQFYEYPAPLAADADTSAYLLANGDLWLWCACEDGARFIRSGELQKTAAEAREELGARVGAMAKAGRQWGGPRRMVVTR